MIDGSLLGWTLGVAVSLLQVLGVLSALDAVMHARTPQGSTAWVVALVLMPLLALPAYWAFGRSRFEGYVHDVRQFDAEVDARLDDRRDAIAEWEAPPETARDERTASELRGFAGLARLPFMRGNRLRLLVDGQATFGAILAAIDQAEATVLAQFYIVRDDGLGCDFQRRLLAAAARGVRVRFIYDGVGSYKLPRRYVRTLRQAGVEVQEFSGGRSWLGHFRINFRNHRKIVVVDGRQAFVGGLNVGDEYLGLDPVLAPGATRTSPWRVPPCRCSSCRPRATGTTAAGRSPTGSAGTWRRRPRATSTPSSWPPARPTRSRPPGSSTPRPSPRPSAGSGSRAPTSSPTARS